MTKYYVAKLNISENIFNNNLQDIKMNKIPKLLMQFNHDDSADTIFYIESVKSGQVNVEHIKWTITDIRKMSKDIIEGNLTKVFLKPELEIEGTRTKKGFAEQVRTAHFYYLINSEQLIFQSTSDINFHIFCQKFEKVLIEGDTNFEVGTVVIKLLTHVLQFQQKIMDQPVFRVQLHFTAPNDPKTSGSIADILLHNGAKKGDFKVENFDDEEGLVKTDENGKPSALFTDFMGLLSKGYGSLTAWVGNRKKPTKIQSSSFPMRVPINSRESDETIVQHLKAEAKLIEKEQSENQYDRK